MVWEPAAQMMQTVAEDVPTYVPTGQFVQLGAPEAENLPASQLVQSADESAPVSPLYLPAAQPWHEVVVVKDWKKPAAQSSQAVLRPVAMLYLPSGHAVHVEDSALSWKRPAAQLVQTVAPSQAYLPAAHVLQVVATLEPVAVENWPLAHWEHWAIPPVVW